MKNFFETDGIVSLREARMTHITLRPGAESAPAPEQPQGPRRVDMRADQVPEELLRSIVERRNGAQEEATETAATHLDTIASGVQRNLDALYSSPNVSPQFVKEYLDSVNQQLHPRGLHASSANRQARISPYNPRQFPPEQIAKKNRINELQGKINQVDRNIRELMQGFRQNAVQYRNQKGASMNRGNVAPEINQMLMQFPQASMQASANPLHQLHALKFRLQQELAGVKSGMIKVAVPGQGGEQDPSLINDPRYAASGTGDTRFNLNGAPGGIGPDGLPLQNAMPTAAEQAAILKLTARWRGIGTEEERDTVEGFLMMDGVDVSNSNLATDEIVMASPEEKGMMFLMGLITVLKSFLDRLNRKKTVIGESAATDKDPATMKSEDITAEKEGNDKKLDELTKKKGKNETDIKDAEKKLKNVEKPLEGEAKTKVETELKQMKEELKKINEEIAKLEKRNKELANPDTFKDREKDITTQDKLKDDPLFKDFQNAKEQMKQKLRSAFEQVLDSKDAAGNMKKLGEELGVDLSDTGLNIKDAVEALVTFMDAFVDSSGLEKNGAGKYRMTMDVVKPFESIMKNPLLAKLQKAMREDMPAFTQEMAAAIDLELTFAGDRVMTTFMDGQTLLKEMF